MATNKQPSTRAAVATARVRGNMPSTTHPLFSHPAVLALVAASNGALTLHQPSATVPKRAKLALYYNGKPAAYVSVTAAGTVRVRNRKQGFNATCPGTYNTPKQLATAVAKWAKARNAARAKA